MLKELCISFQSIYFSCKQPLLDECQFKKDCLGCKSSDNKMYTLLHTCFFYVFNQPNEIINIQFGKNNIAKILQTYIFNFMDEKMSYESFVHTIP
jgi:hypothetical protein